MIFFVFGVKRNGNHAILNWLYKMIPDYVHLNNLPPELITKQNFVTHLTKTKTASKNNYIDKQWTQYSDKNNLIISVENAVLEQIVKTVTKICTDLKLKFTIIVVLREPRNALASIWKVYDKNLDILNFHQKMWISYAEELLAKKVCMYKDVVCVMYDKWFTDVDYRKAVAKKLDLKFEDSNYDKIFKHGVSSFDGYKYQNSASKMNVLNRFSFFKDDQQFKIVASDKRLAKLWVKLCSF